MTNDDVLDRIQIHTERAVDIMENPYSDYLDKVRALEIYLGSVSSTLRKRPPRKHPRRHRFWCELFGSLRRVQA